MIGLTRPPRSRKGERQVESRRALNPEALAQFSRAILWHVVRQRAGRRGVTALHWKFRSGDERYPGQSFLPNDLRQSIADKIIRGKRPDHEKYRSRRTPPD